MKRAVILHCDIPGRHYRIEDFRMPLKDVGVIRDVAGIGAFQISHVWLLVMWIDEAKKMLLDAGQLTARVKTYLVVNSARQEVRAKLHWVAYDVSNDAIRRAFGEYGEVKEVTREKWKVPDFKGVESSTRLVRLGLRKGIALKHLGRGTVLVLVPGVAPICLRCRTSRHIRGNCPVPRCTD